MEAKKGQVYYSSDYLFTWKETGERTFPIKGIMEVKFFAKAMQPVGVRPQDS